MPTCAVPQGTLSAHGPAHVSAHGSGHAGETLGWTLVELGTVLATSAALAGYLGLWWWARDRGAWSRWRTISWGVGVACVAAALVGPLAEAAHDDFTAHMGGHLLLGMVGPLLLVRAAPVTLLLRALPVARARQVTRFLSRRPVEVLSHPVTAGVLNAGGLWLLYTTGLYGLMHSSAAVHALVHLHLLLAGYLLADALVGVDPRRHRAGFGVRAGVLVVFMALHSILAKWVYAHPPAGVEAADARAGAQLMYYGGDVVDVTMIVLLFAGAARASRSGRRSHPAAVRCPGSQEHNGPHDGCAPDQRRPAQGAQRLHPLHDVVGVPPARPPR